MLKTTKEKLVVNERNKRNAVFYKKKHVSKRKAVLSLPRSIDHCMSGSTKRLFHTIPINLHVHTTYHLENTSSFTREHRRKGLRLNRNSSTVITLLFTSKMNMFEKVNYIP